MGYKTRMDASPKPSSHPSQGPLNLSPAQEHIWMQRLLRLAEQAGRAGEIPVAAAVLDERGHCIGWGTNRRHLQQDPFGHAEMAAMAQAASLLRDWRLNRCTLVVTLEPCPMCAGAAVQARVGQVIYGAGDPKRGALGGCLDLANHASAHHHMRVRGGVLEPQARRQLEEWFRRRRRRHRLHPGAQAPPP